MYLMAYLYLSTSAVYRGGESDVKENNVCSIDYYRQTTRDDHVCTIGIILGSGAPLL
jgi:hypothetical protein